MEEKPNDQTNFTPSNQTVEEAKPSSGMRGAYALGVIAVLLLAAVAFFWFGNKSSNTTDTSLADTAVIATVNGETINNADLAMSMQQIAATAVAQGIDATSPDVQVEIRDRALDVLVNTELLLQAAAAEGITVTPETVNTRLDQIVAELGGEEALQARLDELGIDAATLRTDIENELTIQILLDEVFAAEDVTVDEAEIAEAYQLAGGSESGVTLEEVEGQLRLSVQTAKEQAVLDSYIETLRSDADITVAGE